VEEKWRPRHVTDYRVVQHDLQVNAWVMAYRKLAWDRVLDWLGPDQGRLEVPTTYEPQRRRFRPLEIPEVELDHYDRARELKLEHPRPVVPDATLSLYFDEADREFDLLVELDRTRRPVKNVDKLRRYDALLTVWWRAVDRYRGRREAPAVVFVCGDEQAAFGLMRAAHQELSGRIARPGTRSEEWKSPARKRALFAAEQDVHRGSMRAWQLPPVPSDSSDPRDFWESQVLLPGAGERRA
jgi:hypothetical protein